MVRALRCASSSSEKRAAARPTRLKSTVATSASSDVTGSTGSAVPSRATKAPTASARLVDQQRQMGEGRHLRVQGAEDLDLGGAVGDVVLAADDVRDAESNVVDHRGEAVEIAAVSAHQHRIALARLIDVLGPAHQIVPAPFLGCGLEAPVRPAAFAFQAGAVGIAELERGAVVDRRAALREQALALEFEL